MVCGIIRVDIRVAIPWRRQACDQDRYGCVACPTEPAKIAGLGAVEQVGQCITHVGFLHCLNRQRDGVKLTTARNSRWRLYTHRLGSSKEGSERDDEQRKAKNDCQQRFEFGYHTFTYLCSIKQ